MLVAIPAYGTINSAIEVDPPGQVNTEVADGRHVEAVGGQSDYARAGHRSVGGRSLIALPAAARGGTVSRFVARIGGPVTTFRSDVDVVVIEFGSAELRGQSLAIRARRLIGIAHPSSQDALMSEAVDVLRG